MVREISKKRSNNGLREFGFSGFKYVVNGVKFVVVNAVYFPMVGKGMEARAHQYIDNCQV